MYKGALVAAFLMTSVMTHGAILGAEPHYTAAQQQLIEVDKRMQRAFVEKDMAAINSILTDDYVLVLSDGSQRTKAKVLKDVASSDSQWEVNETSDWEVKIHGPVAIVVATLHQKGTDHGTPFDSNVRFSDTYIRENGHWRNVHAHASRAVPVR
jgi:ketosteroid isomerase-like protein